MESITFAGDNSVLFDHGVYFFSNLKLRSRYLGAMMDLMRNSANFALTDTVYKSRSTARGARFRAKIFQLPVCQRLRSNPTVTRTEARICASTHAHSALQSRDCRLQLYSSGRRQTQLDARLTSPPLKTAVSG